MTDPRDCVCGLAAELSIAFSSIEGSGCRPIATILGELRPALDRLADVRIAEAPFRYSRCSHDYLILDCPICNEKVFG